MAAPLELVNRTILLLYPSRLRRNHGAEMLAAVEDEWRARAGMRGAIGFVLWLSADVTRSMLLDRRPRWPHRRARPGFTHRPRNRERMSTLIHDLRYAARSLTRTPMFTAAAVVTLALGIGATTAVFSVVDRVLLRPLPYPESERLVLISHPVPGIATGDWGLSSAGYFYFREQSRTLSDIGAYQGQTAVVTGEGDPERVNVAAFTVTMLSTLGVAPVLGRPFTPEDDVPGAAPVVMLSHDLWTRRYGADTTIVGGSIFLNGSAHEVIGVLPPGFHYPLATTQLWTALRLDPTRIINQHTYAGVGRLQPGMTPADAQRELRAFVDRFPEEFPTAYTTQFIEGSRFDVRVRTMLDAAVGDVRQGLWIVLATVGVVLAMACANVANLFIVRSDTRRREVALRTALGADRARLLQHHATEIGILAAAGGVLGVGVAWLGVKALVVYAPENLPRVADIAMDARALLVAVGLTALSAVLFGITPMLRRHDTAITDALRDGTHGATPGVARQRLRSALVVVQVTMALVLLGASGLLFRSFLNLQSVDLGFRAANVQTVRLSLTTSEYESRQARYRVFETVRERIGALSQVSAAGYTNQLEIADRAWDNATEIGDLPEGGSRNAIVDQKFAGIGYFETMGMELLEGRYFERADFDSVTPGAVITAALAEQFWPGESALGKRLRPLFIDFPWHRVVGVIRDVRTEGIRQVPEPTAYFPYTDARPGTLALAVRTTLAPSALLPIIQREVWALDPNVPIAGLTAMSDIVAEDMAQTTFTVSLLGLAAAMAILLGSVGLYGVVSYAVNQRTHELGIRIALGAKGLQVGGMVLGQTLRLTGVGIVLGVVAALASNRVLSGVLFEISATDPVTMAAVAGLLALVAVAAGLAPARRATRIDPLEALRTE